MINVSCHDICSWERCVHIASQMFNKGKKLCLLPMNFCFSTKKLSLSLDKLQIERRVSNQQPRWGRVSSFCNNRKTTPLKKVLIFISIFPSCTNRYMYHMYDVKMRWDTFWVYNVMLGGEGTPNNQCPATLVHSSWTIWPFVYVWGFEGRC